MFTKACFWMFVWFITTSYRHQPRMVGKLYRLTGKKGWLHQLVMGEAEMRWIDVVCSGTPELYKAAMNKLNEWECLFRLPMTISDAEYAKEEEERMTYIGAHYSTSEFI